MTIIKHFFMPYTGNKWGETDALIEEFERINADGHVSTVVEPFCGSSAFSVALALKYPNKFEYILNDNNKQLMRLYESALNGINFDCFIGVVQDKLCDITREKYNELKQSDEMVDWFILNKFYAIKQGLFPLNFDKKKAMSKMDLLRDAPIFYFLQTEKVTLKNYDGMAVYQNFKDCGDVLVFCDPPYLMCDNTFYKNTDMSIYEHIAEHPITDEVANIMFCLKNDFITRLLFKGAVFGEPYQKSYRPYRKITNHVIIRNG